MSTVDRWNAAQLLGKETYWLLDIVYAGKTYRLAHQSVTVTSTLLGSLQYAPGLVEDVTLKTEFSLFSDAAERRTIAITAFLDDDVAALEALGHDMSGSPVTLSKWIDGQDYDDRRVFMIGRMRDPIYGGRYLPVAFTLEESLFDDPALVPTTSQQVNAATTNTSNLDKDDIGLYYPVVIGYPGRVPDLSGILVVAGSQGVWRCKADGSQEMIIAGHPTNANVVYLLNDDWTSGSAYVAVQTYDDQGQPITVVQSASGVAVVVVAFAGLNGIGARAELLAVYSASDPTLNTQTAVFVAWYEGVGVGATSGGLVQNGQIVRAAGDVLAWMLAQSKFPTDTNRIAAIAGAINTIQIDTTIDAQTRPWDWVTTNLLPLLPVSVAMGPFGAYLVRWNPDATTRDAVAILDADANPEIEFGESISTDTTRRANDITLNYALDIRTGVYQKSMRLTGAPEEAAATCVLITRGDDSILITAVTPGPNGIGIVVTVDLSGGAGAIVVSESAAAKTVTIGAGNAFTTIDIVNAINNGLLTVRAVLRSGDGTQSVNGAYNVDESGTGSATFLTAAFSQTVTTTGPATSTEVYSLYAGMSQRRYRQVANAQGDGRFPRVMSSLCLYESASVAAVLGWMIRAFSFSHKSVIASMPENTHGWLELGHEVALTCSRLGLSSVLAFVQGLEYSNDGRIVARFTMIPDPVRER